jgi:hypothetical protein
MFEFIKNLFKKKEDTIEENGLVLPLVESEEPIVKKPKKVKKVKLIEPEITVAKKRGRPKKT